MDLTKLTLPSAVEADGRFYEIHTEHPYWIRFSQVIKDKNAVLYDFDFLYKNEIPENRKDGFDSLCSFFYEKKEIPRKDFTSSSNEIPYDYTVDSDLIFSAILSQYGVDISETPVHWHKFRAMLEGLHGTKLNDIISYRLYEPAKKTDSYEKSMLRLKRLWHIPDEDDRLAAEAREKFNALLDGSSSG